jgi:hypothetical protein
LISGKVHPSLFLKGQGHSENTHVKKILFQLYFMLLISIKGFCKVILKRSWSFTICTFNREKNPSFQQFVNSYWSYSMQTNNRLIDFRQNLLKAIFIMSWLHKIYTLFMKRRLFQQDFKIFNKNKISQRILKLS